MQTYTKKDVEKIDPKGFIGSKATMVIDELTVGVTIKDARVRFGHIDVLVEPINGSGKQWVEKHRISLVS